MARVLILGARGRLGRALARRQAQAHEVIGWGRQEADLLNPKELAPKVQLAGPDVIVNCAALTDVDRCEQERAIALAINASAPGILAKAARACGARLIHISTDYVFSGEAQCPYAEEDAAHPLSWYGATKLEGESSVLQADSRHAVVRVSWVFGPDREAFVDKALQSAVRGEPVRAVADKFSSPSYTHDISDAIAPLIEGRGEGGVYHVCNAGVCSWRDWAQEAVDAAAALGIEVRTQVDPLRLADLRAMVAPRPVYSAMASAKIERLLGRPMRSWQEAVREYVGLLFNAGRLRRED